MTVLGIAAPVGILTGLAAWLSAGGASAGLNSLDPLEGQIRQLRAPKNNGASHVSVSLSGLADSPLFALTTGPGALRDPSVRLDGVALTRQRTAALISIDGASADWISVGESRSGLTLQAVTASKITVELPTGVKDVGLGEQLGATAPAPQPTNTQPQFASDQPPAGYRMPPPPASAPVQ